MVPKDGIQAEPTVAPPSSKDLDTLVARMFPTFFSDETKGAPSIPSRTHDRWYVGDLEPWTDFPRDALAFAQSDGFVTMYDAWKGVLQERRDSAHPVRASGGNSDSISSDIYTIKKPVEPVEGEYDTSTMIARIRPEIKHPGLVYAMDVILENGNPNETIEPRLGAHMPLTSGKSWLNDALQQPESRDWKSLRRILGEIAYYMIGIKLRYGFVSANGQSIAVKVEIMTHDNDGTMWYPRLWYSADQNLGRLSVFYLTYLASRDGPVTNFASMLYQSSFVAWAEAGKDLVLQKRQLTQDTR